MRKLSFIAGIGCLALVGCSVEQKEVQEAPVNSIAAVAPTIASYKGTWGPTIDVPVDWGTAGLAAVQMTGWFNGAYFYSYYSSDGFARLTTEVEAWEIYKPGALQHETLRLWDDGAKVWMFIVRGGEEIPLVSAAKGENQGWDGIKLHTNFFWENGEICSDGALSGRTFFTGHLNVNGVPAQLTGISNDGCNLSEAQPWGGLAHYDRSALPFW